MHTNSIGEKKDYYKKNGYIQLVAFVSCHIMLQSRSLPSAIAHSYLLASSILHLQSIPDNHIKRSPHIHQNHHAKCMGCKHTASAWDQAYISTLSSSLGSLLSGQSRMKNARAGR